MPDALIAQIQKNENKEVPPEGEAKPQYVLHTYKNRLKFIKEGHLYASRSDFGNAVASYQNYLEALALFYNVPYEKMRPTHFTRGNEDIPELMMVSLVSWELAKIYDRNPKLVSKLKITLDQFVRFSLGHKFQFLNAENIRKYLRKGSCIHTKLFEDAYKRIEVNSKKCFVATYTFGENHQNLVTFYKFRDELSKSISGRYFIKNYYFFAPRFLNTINFLKLDFVAKKIFTPLLNVLEKILRKVVL